MSVVLYFAALLILRPDVPAKEEAEKCLADELSKLGPLSPAELRLLSVALLLLLLWATEGALHPFDTATTTVIGIALLLVPRIGVMHWSQAEKLVPWGTVVLFAACISLGTLMAATARRRGWRT